MELVRRINIRAEFHEDTGSEKPLPICVGCRFHFPYEGMCGNVPFCKEIMTRTLVEMTDRFAQLAPSMETAMAVNPVYDMLSGTSEAIIVARIQQKEEAIA